jgi:hypothetical protein
MHAVCNFMPEEFLLSAVIPRNALSDETRNICPNEEINSLIKTKQYLVNAVGE